VSLALEANGLHVYYAQSHILYDVSLCVGDGEIVALLGRNGAGKTTTLRGLMGLTPPRQGVVRMFGRDVTTTPPFRIAELGVGYVPEGRRIFGGLTVEENLRVPVTRPGPWTVERMFNLFPRLAERRKNLGRHLSGGEQEMLAIARALLVNPHLLILDEPSQGLAPRIVQNVFAVIGRMRKEGIAVLLVEQNVRAAIAVADRVYVLSDGRIVFSGSPDEFTGDQERVQSLVGARGGKLLEKSQVTLGKPATWAGGTPET
jgi:branched-chain amino acid transport system ATP-binding protein